MSHPGILAPVDPKGKEEGALEVAWMPEKAPEGPVSLVVSAADRKAYVFRNGVLIGSSAIEIAGAEQGLGEAVFTRLEEQRHAEPICGGTGGVSLDVDEPGGEDIATDADCRADPGAGRFCAEGVRGAGPGCDDCRNRWRGGPVA